MKKYLGLALIGFCGIFIVMILIYAIGTFTPIFGDGITPPDPDAQMPRLVRTFTMLVICSLLAATGLWLIKPSD